MVHTVNRKRLSFDWWLLVVLLGLLLAGALNQASASMEGVLFKKQLIWFGSGLIIFFALAFYDYRKLLSPRLVIVSYFVLLVLLVILLFKHTRWLRLGGFSVQPSEFAKLVLIVVFSMVLSHRKDPKYLDRRTFLTISIFALPPILLVAAGDLDQGGILFLIFFSYLLAAGIPKRLFLSLLLGCILVGAVAGPKLWAVLKPYQRARVEAFLNPEAFKLDRGYQILQALIAVGSGGLTGQGFKEGLSSRLNYLPEKNTDLAFAVWAEEWGFIGTSVVLILFAALIFLILRLSFQVRDPLGRMLCFGAATMFFWEISINIGGILHLLPVASIPLPFLSYGGSAVLVNLATLGLVFAVSRRRYSFR